MKIFKNIIEDTIEYKKNIQKLDKGLLKPLEIIEDKVITIPLEEYKELLITQGKYEELKHINNQIFSLITPNGFSLITPNGFSLICDHILTKKEIKELKQQGVNI